MFKEIVGKPTSGVTETELGALLAMEHDPSPWGMCEISVLSVINLVFSDLNLE